MTDPKPVQESAPPKPEPLCRRCGRCMREDAYFWCYPCLIATGAVPPELPDKSDPLWWVVDCDRCDGAACRLEELRVKCGITEGSAEEVASVIGQILDARMAEPPRPPAAPSPEEPEIWVEGHAFEPYKFKGCWRCALPKEHPCHGPNPPEPPRGAAAGEEHPADFIREHSAMDDYTKQVIVTAYPGEIRDLVRQVREEGRKAGLGEALVKGETALRLGIPLEQCVGAIRDLFWALGTNGEGGE
jgi:hypothetical protein